MEVPPAAPSLTPLANSLNASVVAHRKLLEGTLDVAAEIGSDVIVWLPVHTDAEPPALAALYAASASRALPQWAVYTPETHRGSAPALDAFLTGEVMVADG